MSATPQNAPLPVAEPLRPFVLTGAASTHRPLTHADAGIPPARFSVPRVMLETFYRAVALVLTSPHYRKYRPFIVEFRTPDKFHFFVDYDGKHVKPELTCMDVKRLIEALHRSVCVGLGCEVTVNIAEAARGNAHFDFARRPSMEPGPLGLHLLWKPALVNTTTAVLITRYALRAIQDALPQHTGFEDALDTSMFRNHTPRAVSLRLPYTVKPDGGRPYYLVGSYSEKEGWEIRPSDHTPHYVRDMMAMTVRNIDDPAWIAMVPTKASRPPPQKRLASDALDPRVGPLQAYLRRVTQDEHLTISALRGGAGSAAPLVAETDSLFCPNFGQQHHKFGYQIFKVFSSKGMYQFCNCRHNTVRAESGLTCAKWSKEIASKQALMRDEPALWSLLAPAQKRQRNKNTTKDLVRHAAQNPQSSQATMDALMKMCKE